MQGSGLHAPACSRLHLWSAHCLGRTGVLLPRMWAVFSLLRKQTGDFEGLFFLFLNLVCFSSQRGSGQDLGLHYCVFGITSKHGGAGEGLCRAASRCPEPRRPAFGRIPCPRGQPSRLRRLPPVAFSTVSRMAGHHLSGFELFRLVENSSFSGGGGLVPGNASSVSLSWGLVAMRQLPSDSKNFLWCLRALSSQG